MKKIYEVRCLGEEFPLNVTDRIYFTWKLAPCKKQKAVTLKICDRFDRCVYEKTFQREEQFIEPDCCGLLLPLEKYSYTLRVQTDAYTETSEPFCFVCGLTQGFAPTAKWISSGSRFIAESDTVGSPALYFRRSFTVDDCSDAVLNICVAGLYELTVNGLKVSDRVLEPAFTQYDKRSLISTYDLSGMLEKGENVMEVVLGDGWYNQTTHDTWGFYRASWRDTPKFILQLNLKDGIVVSDENWETGTGKITANAIRAGEFLDARKETVYTGKARTVASPGDLLYPQQMSPIRECASFSPVSVIRTQGGVIYDFGQNIAGYCSALIRGKEGTEVRLIYSDRVKNGVCDNESNSMYIFNPGLRYQTDTVILGAGQVAYRPKFVYHGFRYVQVTGEAEVDEITAHFVHTDLPRIGHFQCSEPLFNKLYDMSMYAILSNYHGFPTDCPHREKNGWTGDAQLSLETCLMNFDMHAAYRKWLNDFKDNMRGSGQISAIIPSCGWGYNWGSGPAWDVAMFRITYALYDFYCDLNTAKEMLPYLERYVSYMQTYENADGLFCYGLGDWNFPKNISFAVCPTELTDSCYCMEMYRLLYIFCSKFAPDRADYYLRKEKKLCADILGKYAEEQSLTGMCALTAFGICDRTADILRYLKENDYRLHCGILGAKFLFSVLLEKKQADVAFEILSRTDYPSFGFWAVSGQTALCEDFELTNSLNHHMYSFVSEYMMKAFCGIRIGEGMRKITIQPDLPEKLDACQSSVQTRYGILELKTSRSAEDGKRCFDITIPPNTEAIFMYGKEKQILYCGEYSFEL